MLTMVLSETAWIAALGLAIGIPLAILSTRGLSHLLVGVGPADPVTLVAVAVLTLAVALAAGYIPARRAARVDPVVALRAE
jgi:ABC-type antimicrobial peptide transport system permease subunit